MWKIAPALCSILLIYSCSRKDIDHSKVQTVPALKYTVQRDTSGNDMRISFYNDFGSVTFDTIFTAATRTPGMMNIYTYNTKGKLVHQEYIVPVLYTGGYYWAWDYFYQDDTLPTITNRYFKGNQVAKITHFHNASRQLIKDSTYHTPNYGTYTYLTKYEYDAQGRVISSLDLNDTRDTTKYTTYQYTPNRVEKTVTSYNYNPLYITSGLTVTDYSPSGKILSEKGYTVQPAQLYSQVDYTYDAAGSLLKKTTWQTGAPSTEERYFNNSTTGQPERMEYYTSNILRHITTYYYQ